MTGNRKFRETCLVVASHNKGKVREMCDLFKNLVPKLISAAELNLDEPDETGISFAENAEIKALAASKSSNLPSLADDSGLEVDSLNGAPGIFSARFASNNKEKIDKILAALGDTPYRIYQDETDNRSEIKLIPQNPHYKQSPVENTTCLSLYKRPISDINKKSQRIKSIIQSFFWF